MNDLTNIIKEAIKEALRDPEILYSIARAVCEIPLGRAADDIAEEKAKASNTPIEAFPIPESLSEIIERRYKPTFILGSHLTTNLASSFLDGANFYGDEND